ncbi:transmembrane emp24 domain-containing protein 3-like [Tubulanus polymorphus]|uniref:transmembrane emp24 domain-containing protein 3-like n=1 Tax=Tubulanus polymorphus TaxID=672921 RepID=UPI003DA6464A
MDARMFLVTVSLLVLVSVVYAGELTFELPDNAKQCFHEDLDAGVKATIEFQVITGGNYDVDMELFSPSGQILYRDQKKQYDSFTWTTAEKGTFKFCFSNEFSTFTHKTVYFDFQHGSEKPLLPDMAQHATAMTQMESSSVAIHEAMKVVIDYQTHHRLREATGRVFAEDLHDRIQWWSIGESVIVLLVGIGQVLVLRSFFTDKRPMSSVVT